MKKSLKKIQLKKQTVSLLDARTVQNLNGGKEGMLTRLVDSCRKWCPTMIEPECTGK